MKRKITALLLAAALIFALLPTAVVCAVSDAPGEPSKATDIRVNTSYSDNISDGYDQDYYRFTLTASGTISINFQRKNLADKEEYWTAWLFDDKLEEISSYSFTGIEASTDTYLVGLPAGTYYLRFCGGNWNGWNQAYKVSTETYTLSLNYKSTEYCEKENNNTAATATSIVTGKKYQGSINDGYDQDYYRFALTTPGTVSIDFQRSSLASTDEYWITWLYNEKMEEISFYSFDGNGTSTETYLVGLPAGTYYLRLCGGNWNGWNQAYKVSTETYTLSLNFKSTEYCEKENNDTAATATSIVTGKEYQGSINDGYDQDYYRFALTAPSTVRIDFHRPDLASTDEYWITWLYNEKMEEISFYSFNGNGTSTETYLVGLPAGTYYLRLCGGNWNGWNQAYKFSTGTYTLKLNYKETEYCEKELNNSPAASTEIFANHAYTGSINDSYDCDYYRFTLDKTSSVWLQFDRKAIQGTEDYWTANLFSGPTNEIGKYSFNGNETLTKHFLGNLDAGTYYLRIRGAKPSGNTDDAICYRHSTETYSFTISTSTENKNQFTDVNSTDWFASSVTYVVEKDLFNGTDTNTFSPNMSMTRSMLVTVLWRYAGKPAQGSSSFTDVPGGIWYEQAVAWASSNGIVNGIGGGKFNPDGNITREQLSAILYRFAQNRGSYTGARGDLSAFPDSGSVSGWAKDAMNWAVGAGLINGSDGKLLPQGNATRAQVAAILMRYIENIAKYYFDKSDYEIVTENCTWTEAQAAAAAKGGKLVTFESMAEYQFVLDLIAAEGDPNAYYYLGARRDADGTEYHWVDKNNHPVGEALNSANVWCASLWQPGEPNYSWDGNAEAVLLMHNFEEEGRWCWYDGPDNGLTPRRQYAYIVEYDRSFDKSNYEIVTENCTWTEAQAAAAAKGGKLVTFESMSEYRFVLDLIAAEGDPNAYYYLGARRDADGTEYHWVDKSNQLVGEVLNSADAWCANLWQPGEPNYSWDGYAEAVLLMHNFEEEGRWCWYDGPDNGLTPRRQYAYIIEYSAN